MQDPAPSIISICDELLKNGERPSATKVRDIRGKGSNSTIQPGIDEWWDTLIDRMSYFSDYPKLDESVVAAAAKMQKAAQQVAKSEYEESEKNFIERIADLESAKGVLEIKATDLEKITDQQSTHITSANKEILELRDMRGELNNNITLLKAEVFGQQDMLVELRKQLADKAVLVDESKTALRTEIGNKRLVENELIEMEKALAEAKNKFEIESQEFSHVIAQRNDIQVRLEEQLVKSKLAEDELKERIAASELSLGTSIHNAESLTSNLGLKFQEAEVLKVKLASVVSQRDALNKRSNELYEDKDDLKEQLKKQREIELDLNKKILSLSK
jgi:chromosome segregation ATPase